MMLAKLIFLGFLCLLFQPQTAMSQNFTAQQKSLQANINSAYKSKKITSKEYEKLLEEQETIKIAILRAGSDGVMTPDEKNRIHSKLVRARKRLAKYKTNREIY